MLISSQLDMVPREIPTSENNWRQRGNVWRVFSAGIVLALRTQMCELHSPELLSPYCQ